MIQSIFQTALMQMCIIDVRRGWKRVKLNDFTKCVWKLIFHLLFYFLSYSITKWKFIYKYILNVYDQEMRTYYLLCVHELAICLFVDWEKYIDVNWYLKPIGMKNALEYIFHSKVVQTESPSFASWWFSFTHIHFTWIKRTGYEFHSFIQYTELL